MFSEHQLFFSILHILNTSVKISNKIYMCFSKFQHIQQFYEDKNFGICFQFNGRHFDVIHFYWSHYEIKFIKTSM